LFSIISEIWKRRDLVRELVVKDLKLRYSRPMLGFFWAFVLPFSMTLVFYLFFSIILKTKVEEAPFLVYLMSAIFPWRFFQDSLSAATSSLMDNKNLLREARFPAYFIPVSIVLANAINFLPSLAILITAVLIFMKGVPLFIVFLPLVFIVHALITAGLAIILSLVYLKWRDVKFILEVVLLLIFYLSPTVYSLSLMKAVLPAWIFGLFVFNPFTGILNLYRLTLLNGFYSYIAKDVSVWSLMVIPVLFSMGVISFGFHFYKTNKSTINDHLSY